MDHSQQEVLHTVVRQILEDATFVFAEPAEELPEWIDDVLEAEVTFAGPSSGRLLIAMSPDLAVNLAANLLGIDSDDPDAVKRGHGAGGEIANMICGALMEKLFGAEAICRLGIPQVATVEPASHDRRREIATSSLVLLTEEGERFDAFLFIDKQA